MTVSFWQQTQPPTVVDAEIAVVGGGICGLWTALELERRGCSVVLVERSEQLARGASTRNAGYLMRGAADNYALACDSLGRDEARHAWQLSEWNLEVLRSESIRDCASFREQPSCLVAHTPAEAEELTASRELLAEDGFEAALIDGGSDSMWSNAKPLLGLVNPGDAVCQPGELASWLIAKLQRTRFFVGCDVRDIVNRRGRVALTGRSHEFRADRAVICTNALAGQLIPALSDLVTPNRGQMLAARVPGIDLAHAYYANRGSEYIRSDGDMLYVGGCRNVDLAGERTDEDETSEAVQSALETYAAKVLGTPLEPEQILSRWAGIMGFSPDGLPLAGPVGELVEHESLENDQVWFIGGFTGHGMSLAVATARTAVATILDGAERHFPLERVLPSG